jgi:hypothetical protein
MVTPALLRERFERAIGYDEYVASAQPHEAPGWRAMHARVALSEAQRALVASFTRDMPVLVISGTWCGDCVQQVPILGAIARQSPRVRLRLIDRDTNLDFAEHVRVCGGHRVPLAIFMNEDFEFVSLLGDKTLARLRRQAAAALGASCPLPGAPVPADELAAVTGDWLAEFERVALLLRLSAKLRQRHGD